MEVSNELYHHGIKGQKWGVRRTPEQLGHHKVFRPSAGGSYRSDDVIFVSGKVKFDEPVPPTVQDELARMVKAKAKIIVGDAPGADTRVQDYLSKLGYKNVEVYTTDAKVRNNVGGWKVNTISGNGYSEERDVRRQKDIAMTNASTKGFVISSDDDRSDSATSLNVQRMLDAGHDIQFWDYKADELRSNEKKGGNRMSHSELDAHAFIEMQSDELFHHGIKGQKWGVRRFQNPDGTLTPAGRKRRAKYEAKINKRTKKLKAKMDEEGLNTDEQKPKKLSDLTIEELNEAVTRARLEAQLYNEQFNRATNVAKLKEAQKSKGRKFVENYAPKLMDQVVLPVAKDKLDKGTDALLRSVGLDLSSPIEKLQNEATMSKLRADIADNNKKAREASDYDSAYAAEMRKLNRDYEKTNLEAKLEKAKTQKANDGYDPKGQAEKLSDYSDDAIEEEWKRRNS